MSTSQIEYVRCADAAKLLRVSLKHNFPGVKFSVRSKEYAGGASIRIEWTDGPTTEAVNRVSCRFKGADFDGMIDLKSSKTQILAGEGSVREVRFGSDFVFCNRHISPEVSESVKRVLAAGWNPDEWNRMPDYEHDRLVWRIVSKFPIPLDAETAVSEFFRTGGAL